MSNQQEFWRDDVIAVAEGSSHVPARQLLADERASNLAQIRWGSPLTDTQRIDFLGALAEEMRGAHLDAAGNDQLRREELESLYVLIDRVAALDLEQQGTHSGSVVAVLAALEEAIPYLDAHFDGLNEKHAARDMAHTA